MQPLEVTGIGVTTCLGAGRAANWRQVLAGRSGLGPITRFELGDCPVRAGGEAPELSSDPGVPGPPELQQLAAACVEALECAGCSGGRVPAGRRAALVVGSSLAGSSTGEKFFDGYLREGPRAGFCALEGYYIEGQLAELARRLAATGPSALVSNACAAGGSSIARGAALLRAGRADLAICAGYDPLSIFTFAGFGSLLALSRSAVRPFSSAREGMLLGDGYACIVLEPPGRRSASEGAAMGKLVGYGESADSHHLTHPHPQGGGAALAMRRALAVAGISPGDVGYINCHGTATRANDSAEANALRAVFGESLRGVPVSSSKPFFGHTLGAAGTVEAVVTLMALRHGFLPPTLNLEPQDRELGELDLVPVGRASSFRYAMSNSFGFGGSNVSLVFEKGGCDGES